MAKKFSHLHTVTGRSVKVETEIAPGTNVEIVRARLRASQMLSIADENDRGTDPYNNTGQHAILGAGTKI